MKPVLILLLCIISGQTNLLAQHSVQIKQDTTAKWKAQDMSRNKKILLLPEPGLKPDSFGYNNRIYYNGIKHAEYQNRGAEDRRDPLSVDPKAIPNTRVPDQQVLYPDTMK